MAKTAWLFPGHGSQYTGMGRGFRFGDAAVREVFDEAEALSGLALRRLAVDGSREQLRDPRVLEPLLTAFSLAGAALLLARAERPHAVLGYSAGTVAALACAGVVGRGAALRIAVRRGQLLHAVAPRCGGGMASVVGLPAAAVCALLERWSGQVEVAGWNAPDHLTLVGEAAALDAVGAAVGAQGGSWLPVDVAGAWHCERATDAAARAEGLCDDIAFGPPALPFYCSASGRRLTEPGSIRRSLASQLRRPMLWHAAICQLRAAEGVDRFVEVGCGRVLQGMTRRGSRGVQAAPVQFASIHSPA